MDAGVTAELPPSLTPLGGSDPDTVAALPQGSTRGEGECAAPVSGRETALGREGQAEASVGSDLNPSSQCCLRGVTLCTRPESVSMIPSGGGHIQQGPGRAHTLSAELGRPEGAVKIPHPRGG